MNWRFVFNLLSEYCERYAKPEDAGAVPEEQSSDEELSEAEYASSDEEVAGKADPWMHLFHVHVPMYIVTSLFKF